MAEPAAPSRAPAPAVGGSSGDRAGGQGCPLHPAQPPLTSSCHAPLGPSGQHGVTRGDSHSPLVPPLLLLLGPQPSFSSFWGARHPTHPPWAPWAPGAPAGAALGGEPRSPLRPRPSRLSQRHRMASVPSAPPGALGGFGGLSYPAAASSSPPPACTPPAPGPSAG